MVSLLGLWQNWIFTKLSPTLSEKKLNLTKLAYRVGLIVIQLNGVDITSAMMLDKHSIISITLDMNWIRNLLISGWKLPADSATTKMSSLMNLSMNPSLEMSSGIHSFWSHPMDKGLTSNHSTIDLLKPFEKLILLLQSASNPSPLITPSQLDFPIPLAVIDSKIHQSFAITTINLQDWVCKQLTIEWRMVKNWMSLHFWQNFHKVLLLRP